jgi:hypothetical protein
MNAIRASIAQDAGRPTLHMPTVNLNAMAVTGSGVARYFERTGQELGCEQSAAQQPPDG